MELVGSRASDRADHSTRSPAIFCLRVIRDEGELLYRIRTQVCAYDAARRGVCIVVNVYAVENVIIALRASSSDTQLRSQPASQSLLWVRVTDNVADESYARFEVRQVCPRTAVQR